MALNSTAVSGHGAAMRIGGTAIAEIHDIDGPSISVETHDVTHQGCSGREFVAGVIDYGEVSVDANFINDATQGVFLTALQARAATGITMTFPKPGAATITMTFQGIPTSFAVKDPDGPSPTVSLKLKCTGPVYFA